MPLYNCKAKKGPSEVIQEVIEADSPDEAVTKITQRGYYPIRIEPANIAKGTTVRSGVFFGRVRVRDLNLFTRQLASLIKSGVPIIKALNIIIEQTENNTLKNIIQDIAQQVKEGRMLSEAMAKYPHIFPSLYIALIKSGEDSGTLDTVLVRMADHRERIEEIKSRIRAALVYPIIVLCVGILTIFVLVTFVIPQMEKVFKSIGEENLPFITTLLLDTSKIIVAYWHVIIGGLFALFLILRGITVIQKYAYDELKLHLPILGKFFQKSELARFSRTMSLLLTNGIPILSALEISIPTLYNGVIKKELKRVSEGLKTGNSLGYGLKQTPIFTPFMVNLVAVGEESGRLDETLLEITTSYEREVDEAIKIGLSLLEPILILVMGGIVGFIVISMLLPILTMGEMIQ